MIRRTLLTCTLLAGLPLLPELASGQRPVARPDLEGVWNSATATPLQRPRDMADKPFFTPDEAEEWVRRFTERNQEPPPGAPRRGTGTYNTFYREFGTSVVKTLRTSIVTDPPDGRIPPLRPDAEAQRRARNERHQVMENPEELSLQDRCVAFGTEGPPMLPYSYNSNYQIIQTEDAVVIHAEMIHHARIVYLDGRTHPPETIRLLGGHSIGHWVGDTLVVETRNFTDTGGFYGGAGGHFGFDENLRVVERFSLYDAETLLYRFEIEDPTAFTRPWAGELTMTRATGNIYEYACHEGNYSMTNLLRGARATEGRR